MTVQNMPALPPGFYWFVGEPATEVLKDAKGEVVRRLETLELYLMNKLEDDEPIAMKHVSVSYLDDPCEIEQTIRNAATEILDVDNALTVEVMEHYMLMRRLRELTGRTDGKWR